MGVMDMTPEQLAEFCPAAARFAPTLCLVGHPAELTTPARLTMFFAQVAHESAGFMRVSENLDYSAAQLKAMWPAHFDDLSAVDYAHKPVRIANRAYANRLGNGNEASGDGWRYYGRGLIQITGRRNYGACSIALHGRPEVLLEQPDSLEMPIDAVRSAAWFWLSRRCNQFADVGNFEGVTRAINGDLTGLDSRRSWLRRAESVLGIR